MFFISSSLVFLGVLLSKSGEAHIDDGEILEVEEHHDDDWAAPAHEAFKAVTAPCCQKPTIDDVNYILVSTMNGKLMALDASNQGTVLWSLDIDGSPLLSGTLSRMPPMEANGRWYHLVPALDGSLYMYSRDDRLLEPIPLSTEVLLQSSVRIAHDAVAGGKTVTTTGVDPLTGEVRYHCTAANCNNAANDDIQSTLVLRRSTNSVRAVNALTGAERWNLSVAEYDASLVKKHDTGSHHNRISGLRLLMQPPDGIVTAYDGCGNLIWNQNVGNHIVKAWKIEGGELSELSLFDAYNIHTLAVSDEFNQPDNEGGAETLFYLGMSNNDPFILHSGSVKSELQRMARHALDATESIVHQPGSQLVPADKRTFRMQGRTIDDLFQISLGKSYIASSVNRRMIEHRSEELTIVNPSREDGHVGSCPNGEGISLIKEEDMRSAAFEEGNGDKGWYVLKPGKTARKSPFPLKRALKQCAASLSSHVDSWWSFSIGAVAGLTTGMVTIGTVISYFCWRKVQKKLFPIEALKIKRKETKETSSSTSMNGLIESIPPTPSDATPTAPPLSRERRTTSRNSVNEDFTSKFLNDFEPVKLLGHGGFGFVFKAMNRLDEGFYAVKRIAVANNERAIQKVLREVRAMAKLDHRGLTRYYHTWIEKPPPGWQEEKDKEILSDLKLKRKNLNVEETEELASREQPPRFNLSSKNSLASIKQESFDAPAMPEESTDGSWLDSAAGQSQANEDTTTTDSDSSDSADEDEHMSKRIGKLKSERSVERSDGIIFGSHKSKSSKSSSENLWASNVQQVLVATVDEEVLPSRNTEHKVYLYIQMQLCQEKTLHTWLKRHKKLEDRAIPTVKGWLVQLCSAVNYIHSQGMIHRDLKPENIFFFDDDHQHLKVGDLGLVTGNAPDEALEEQLSKASHSPHTDNVGTRGYMSPEQISNRPYTYKIDVFSLGLIFCELVIPFQTFMERSRTLGSLQRGEEPAILKNCGKAEKKMILWMTRLNPNERPTTEDILSSDYLADVEDFGDRSLRRLQSERNISFEKKASVHF